eukprot:TRINITY_DN1318_c0_g2_i2.p1 TRINITY_DN1318_c0_g2~~TRINITY_DN1318_c0_g2_i2.p1  ORF type:complete len:190 (+),score=9.04 TRINITY_DN1318_c0_g2_i2:86-655(+)
MSVLDHVKKYAVRFNSVYTHSLNNYPITTKSVACGLMFFGGDLISQAIEQKRVRGLEWDKGRTARMTAYGTFVLGPVGHYWYKFLDHRLPATDNVTIAKKVAMDQFLFAPPYYALFYYAMPLMEGRNHKEAVDNVKKNFLMTYAVDMTIWPAAQAFNFKVLQPDQRVLFVSAVSILWNAFLSHMQHKHE